MFIYTRSGNEARHDDLRLIPEAIPAVSSHGNDQVATRRVGDGERVAIAAIGEHELAFVISAPKLVRLQGARATDTSLRATMPNQLLVRCAAGTPLAPVQLR